MAPTTEELTEHKFEEVIEETQERPDLDKLKQRRPPKDGPCKRCGLDRPLNRLFLCYACWVKTVLEDKFGWREGMSHPDSCDCEVPNAHQRSGPGD